MKTAFRVDVIRQDAEDLHKLGYARQLFREMGGVFQFRSLFYTIAVSAN